MSKGVSNFLAGGLASNMYWAMALREYSSGEHIARWCQLIRPALDNIKNRIMTDSVTQPRYKGVIDAYKQVWTETRDPSKGFRWNSIARVKNFYRVSTASQEQRGICLEDLS